MLITTAIAYAKGSFRTLRAKCSLFDTRNKGSAAAHHKPLHKASFCIGIRMLSADLA